MPLRALARLPATAGERVSRLLHTLVFSLPTPGWKSAPSAAGAAGTATTTAAAAPAAPTAVLNFTTAAAAAAADPAGDSLGVAAVAIPDPGASRALAAGIGPLSFVGSGYGMMLVLIAILLNRIHHIVQRPRIRPPPPELMPGLPTTVYGAFRLQLARWLTSSATPHWLRLPGLFGLARAWVLFTVVTLQTAEVWPLDVAARAHAITASWPAFLSSAVQYGAQSVDQVGKWGGDKEMADVCWCVFLCVCGGLVFGALANGLDRARRRDVGAGFNLFGYSFLLHLYSSPLTHHSPPPATHHGRPDVHALFHLWVGLTELTWLQAIELSPNIRRNQLLPTGVCGALGLIHFVYALATAPLRFPSFTFVTHLLALLLSVVILSTILLRGLTHLLTIGYVPSPVWSSLLPHEGAIPSIEDDAGVALLKLGTACIEATSYSGLRNELAPVQLHPSLKLSVAGCDQLDRPAHIMSGGFDTRIDDIQVAELTDPNAESRYMRELGNFYRACVALAKDVFWVTLLGTPLGRKVYRNVWRAYHGRWWYGPRQWRIWRRDAWAAAPQVPRQRNEPPGLANAYAMGWSSSVRVRPEIPVAPLVARSTPMPRAAPVNGDYSYDQVLRGEVELPDDEDEWESHASGSSAGSVSGDEEDETPILYRDLMVREDSAEPEDPATALQPILFAHMTSTGTPMTRRRYNALLGGRNGTPTPPPPPVDPFAQVVLSRRAQGGVSDIDVAPNTGGERDEWDEERRRSCVVCMSQPRDVIVWPCRCLLMCDDCRESLAARLPAKEHACPNCRTKVEGYSRIFVP